MYYKIWRSQESFKDRRIELSYEWYIMFFLIIYELSQSKQENDSEWYCALYAYGLWQHNILKALDYHTVSQFLAYFPL